MTDKDKKTGAPVAPDNTPPVVTDPPAAPEDAPEPTLTLEGATAELTRARKEAATYREKLRNLEAAEEAAAEAERRKALTAEQRAAEAEAKAEAATKAAEARIQAAERRESLYGKVVDPAAALKLLEDKHLAEDGSVDVEKFLVDFPMFAPTAAGPDGPTPTRGAGGQTPKHAGPNPWAADTRNLTAQARILRENPALAKQLQDAAKEG